MVEGLNPFWYSVVLITTLVGPACLAITVVAGIVWLIVRSRVSRIVFFALLTCTIIAGLSWLAALMLMGTSWP